MSRIRHAMSVALVSLAVGGCTQSVTFYRPAIATGYTSDTSKWHVGPWGTCDNVSRGIQFEYRLSDPRRLVKVALMATQPRSGNDASGALLFIGRYTDDPKPDWTGHRTPEKQKEFEALTAWSFKQTSLYSFSSDTIAVSWEHGHRKLVPITGLTARGNRFEASANSFQRKIQPSGLTGEWFELSIPPFTVDGTAVHLPPVRFKRETTTALRIINC